MKTFTKFTALLLTACAIGFSSVNAQDEAKEGLINTVKKLTGPVAKPYLSPIANGFGANLNTGWSSRVPKAKYLGFDLQFGVVAMGANVGNDSKDFSVQDNYRFTRADAEKLTEGITYAPARESIINQIIARDFNVTISGATAIGKKDNTVKVQTGAERFSYMGQNYDIPAQAIDLKIGGLTNEISYVPLAVPQLTIGTIFGTQATVRYLPTFKNESEDLGTIELKYSGFGIQHNPAIWFSNPLPVDLAVGFFTQKLTISDMFESTATEYGIYASRTFGPGFLNVTPYAGFSMQSSKMTVNYTVESSELGSVPVNLELEGGNKSKISVGAAFKIFLLNLNVDYNIAKYNTFSAGVGFIF